VAGVHRLHQFFDVTNLSAERRAGAVYALRTWCKTNSLFSQCNLNTKTRYAATGKFQIRKKKRFSNEKWEVA
jgi:hypothetical protein